MKSLFETHRPKTLDAVIGQPKAVKTIKRLLERGIGSRSVWISGASGTGKTTLARIIASSIADDLYITEYDSADCLSVSEIDKIESEMSYFAFGGRGKCWIINEAHGLRKQSIRKLLGLLERIPKNVCIIFTTTREGEAGLFDDQIDCGALLSRCFRITLTNQALARPFAEHCRNIATAENLNGKPIESYIRLAQRCKNNCRQMLMEIESGVML